MSKFIQQIINFFSSKEILNNEKANINKDIINKRNNNPNNGNNKCKSNNNNLDSSKKNKDEKNNIIADTFNYSPEITFSQMPILYHNDAFNSSWNGFKASLNFRPSQFFNLDYMINIEKIFQ